MPKRKERRSLTADERNELERLVRSGKTENRLAERAKMVLWSREGISGNQIAKRLGRDADTVYRQLNRFDAEGITGLSDRSRPGRPHEYTERERGEMIAVARTDPQALGRPFGYWSLKRLAEYITNTLNIPISREHLGRILNAEGLRWYQEKTYFTERPDPQFAEKRGP